jgi:hypothetical protein
VSWDGFWALFAIGTAAGWLYAAWVGWLDPIVGMLGSL